MHVRGVTVEILHEADTIGVFEIKGKNETLVASGEDSFTLFCSACHKFPERYIGPELGEHVRAGGAASQRSHPR